MKDIVITQAFTGYPDDKTETAYAPSPDAISVPDRFAENVVGKKLARWATPAAKKPEPKPRRAKTVARASKPGPRDRKPEPEPALQSPAADVVKGEDA